MIELAITSCELFLRLVAGRILAFDSFGSWKVEIHGFVPGLDP